MIKSSEYGFSPGNSPDKNREALQKMLDMTGDITIDIPGEYKVSGTLTIKSDTRIGFQNGVFVKRIYDGDEKAGPFLVNEGAYERKYDNNISVIGLKLITDGKNVIDNKVVGLIAQVEFFYVKNLIIEDFECLDLGTASFCIQICTFENIVCENIRIEGMKDAIHLGPGRYFTIRNCKFRTYDDPIALNANDYATANPQMGWIEDGIVENCHDLNQESTTGYFCRLLGGSWLEWKEGMTIRNSDTVISGGRMYRAKMPADGREYVTLTRPEHKSGERVLDGIRWVMSQDDNVSNNCGCRNILFKDIYLEKKRPVAFSFHFDNDVYSHSYYPYSEAPVQTDITFDGIHISGDIDYLIRSTTPVGRVIIKNSTLDSCNIRYGDRGVPGINYNETEMIFENVTLRGDTVLSSAEGRKTRLVYKNVTQDGNIKYDGQFRF